MEIAVATNPYIPEGTVLSLQSAIQNFTTIPITTPIWCGYDKAYTTSTQNVIYQYYYNTPVYRGVYYYGSTISGSFLASNAYAVPYIETPEQALEREKVYLAEKVKRGLAEKRAEELLMLILTDKQKHQYENLGYFETLVNDKVYRIRKGRSGNVKLVEKGIERESFCIHPTEYMPDQDNMLAQYLMLHSNETEFLRKANKTLLY